MSRTRSRGDSCPRLSTVSELGKTKALTLGPKAPRSQGPLLVGATGFEPATTCTPSGEGELAAPGNPSPGLAPVRHPRGIIGETAPADLVDAKVGEAVPAPGSGFLVPPVSPRPALRALKTLPERLLTVAEVAATLGVCRATIYKLCERGKLVHVRISNSIRFECRAVQALVAVRLRSR